LFEEPLDGQHLDALGALGETSLSNPGQLIDQGLQLLLRQLGVTRAAVATLDGGTLESLWCAGEPGACVPERLDPMRNFCAQVLKHPGRTLVVRDAQADPQWREHAAFAELGVAAYLGAPLRHSGALVGVLSAQSLAPRAWKRSEIALVTCMGHLFSKAMEVEAVKYDLWKTRQALDLTSAVVEDSALESPDTGLPNLRYLEVWARSSLYLAKRRGETIALVTWTAPAPDRAGKQALKDLAESLRGEDLLVDLGQGRLLLLLPRTDQAGASLLLERIRLQAGELAMGGTVWNPLLKPDRDSKDLMWALDRAKQAHLDSVIHSADGHGPVAWKVVEASRASLVDDSAQEASWHVRQQ